MRPAAAVAFAVTFLAVCTQSPVVSKVEVPAIELAIKVSDSVLVSGKTDTIRVTVKNTLPQIARIIFPTQCQVKVYVRNSASTVVIPASGDYQCSTVTSQMTVPANGSLVLPYVWSGTQSFLPEVSAALPYGVYFVSASLETVGLLSIAFPVRIRFAQTR